MPLWGLEVLLWSWWLGWLCTCQKTWCRPFQMSIISQKSLSMCSGADFHLDFVWQSWWIFQVPDSRHQIRDPQQLEKLYFWISSSTLQEGCPSCTPWPWCPFSVCYALDLVNDSNAKWAARLAKHLVMGDPIWILLYILMIAHLSFAFAFVNEWRRNCR